jgi:cation transport ATPase
MYTLIGLGVLVAYAYSLFRHVHARPRFRSAMRDEHGMVGVYFEVAAVIIGLVLLGEWWSSPRGAARAGHPPAAGTRAEVRTTRASRWARRRTFHSIASQSGIECASVRVKRSRSTVAFSKGGRPSTNRC